MAAAQSMAAKSELRHHNSLSLSFPAGGLLAVITSTSSLLPPACLLFLTVNSGMAAYRAREDPRMLAFVVSAYGNLMLLFGCLRTYERTPARNVPRRKQLRMAILLLSSALNLSFAYHVSRILPLALSAAVWSIAALVTAVGFCLFFVYGGESHYGDRHGQLAGGDRNDDATDAFLG